MAVTWAWADDFSGEALVSHWVGGHFNRSEEVTVALGDGLAFTFPQGEAYASAGVVTRDPLVGDFEADVQFEVENPTAGSTFELAAIRVAPPPDTGWPPRVFTDAHRVFNVHGSPPYVSSEFDEDDGWRIGWNFGDRQGRRNEHGDWVADNRDNRYGRPVGGPVVGPASGWLQLARTQGRFWTTHGRVTDADPWVRSGEVETELLAGPVHLRIVAKHWFKRRPEDPVEHAPANRIVIKRFILRTASKGVAHALDRE